MATPPRLFFGNPPLAAAARGFDYYMRRQQDQRRATRGRQQARQRPQLRRKAACRQSGFGAFQDGNAQNSWVTVPVAPEDFMPTAINRATQISKTDKYPPPSAL